MQYFVAVAAWLSGFVARVPVASLFHWLRGLVAGLFSWLQWPKLSMVSVHVFHG
jgi:hypothetical protein